MKERLYPFRYVLLNAEHFPWNAQLYLPKTGSWDLESFCAVLRSDLDGENAEEDPEFAVLNNLRYVLQFGDVQDIVANAREQIPNANEGQLFRAFQYYFKNDAFIDFENEAP